MIENIKQYTFTAWPGSLKWLVPSRVIRVPNVYTVKIGAVLGKRVWYTSHFTSYHYKQVSIKI